MARTSICRPPEPKRASSPGAYTDASRLPIWLRRMGVATMTVESSGLVLPGLSTYSRLAGMWRASSAWHIAGSQEMTLADPTCAATQAAAVRLSVAASTGPALRVPLRPALLPRAVLPAAGFPPLWWNTAKPAASRATVTVVTRTPAIR